MSLRFAQFESDDTEYETDDALKEETTTKTLPLYQIM